LDLVALCIFTRKAGIDDLEALYKIELECFGREAFAKSLFAYFLTSSDFVNLVAEVGEEIAGFVIGSVQHHNSRATGHVLSLDVSGGYRRKGIGLALLCELEKILAEDRVEACFLEARADNAAALRLYQKQGFKVVETLEDYYGRGVHGLRLKKDLRHR